MSYIPVKRGRAGLGATPAVNPLSQIPWRRDWEPSDAQIKSNIDFPGRPSYCWKAINAGTSFWSTDEDYDMAEEDQRCWDKAWGANYEKVRLAQSTAARDALVAKLRAEALARGGYEMPGPLPGTSPTALVNAQSEYMQSGNKRGTSNVVKMVAVGVIGAAALALAISVASR